jgi:hypothetical protein
MLLTHVRQEWLLVFERGVCFGIAAEFSSMTCLVLVPLISGFEEMVEQLAIFKSTNIWEKITEHMVSKSPNKLSQC